MATSSSILSFSTEKEGDLVLLDHLITEKIKSSEISNGIVTVFCPGSTGAITTIEYEEGLKKDFPEVLSNIVPNSFPFLHNSLNYDDNGRSHVKASIIGPSLTIPFVNQKLTLGTWQQIVFVELDTHARSRRLQIMILGE